MQIKWGVCSLLLFSCAASAIPLPPGPTDGGVTAAPGTEKSASNKPALALKIPPGSQNAPSSGSNTSPTHQTPALQVPDDQTVPSSGNSGNTTPKTSPSTLALQIPGGQKAPPSAGSTSPSSPNLEVIGGRRKSTGAMFSEKEQQDLRASTGDKTPVDPVPVKGRESPIRKGDPMKSWLHDPNITQNPDAAPVPEVAVSVTDYDSKLPPTHKKAS